MGQKETVVTNKNRIMIYGPKNDGTYTVEFKTADGEALASNHRFSPKPIRTSEPRSTAPSRCSCGCPPIVLG
jgi:hypothetical protein